MSGATKRVMTGWVICEAGSMTPIEQEVDAIVHAQLFFDLKEAKIASSIDRDEHILPVRVTISPVCESCGHLLIRRPPKQKKASKK